MMTMLEHAPPKDRYPLRIVDATLDRLVEDDAAELWSVIERERAHLDTFQPASELTPQELRTTIERAVRAWEAGYQYRFVVRHAGSIVGMCGFVDVFEESGVGEVGYWLSKMSSGIGLATASVHTLTSAAFAQLGLQRVEVTTAMGNMPARRVVERLGFTLEGVRRSCERIASGELVDHAIYGVLVGEWKA